jgi:pimeloyl-ACP methyl ester carboxylesterase
VAPNRRGYHPRTPASREDFRTDAADIAQLCRRPVHLVGHSYGAVVALLAAARAPGTIKSLTLIEPPPLPSVHGIQEVRDWVHRMAVLRTAGPQDPAAFLTAFMHLVGGPAEAADHSDQLRAQVELLRSSVPAWTADPPWRLLSACRIPALVVSGGHSVVFEAAADDIAEQMAGVRRVLAGAGHFVQRHPGFAGLLTGFLRTHEPEPAVRTGDSLSCSS